MRVDDVGEGGSDGTTVCSKSVSCCTCCFRLATSPNSACSTAAAAAAATTAAAECSSRRAAGSKPCSLLGAVVMCNAELSGCRLPAIRRAELHEKAVVLAGDRTTIMNHSVSLQGSQKPASQSIEAPSYPP